MKLNYALCIKKNIENYYVIDLICMYIKTISENNYMRSGQRDAKKVTVIDLVKKGNV